MHQHLPPTVTFVTLLFVRCNIFLWTAVKRFPSRLVSGFPSRQWTRLVSRGSSYLPQCLIASRNPKLIIRTTTTYSTTTEPPGLNSRRCARRTITGGVICPTKPNTTESGENVHKMGDLKLPSSMWLQVALFLDCRSLSIQCFSSPAHLYSPASLLHWTYFTCERKKRGRETWQLTLLSPFQDCTE